MAEPNRDIFINCPFDPDYKPLFEAIVFTVIRSGFVARSALETDNAADTRFEKICAIVGACRLGVHDISRTETSGDPPLPRFNMPLELGLFLGAKKYGGRAQRGKTCIIFDREPYRYQHYISDIAGQDIHSHDGEVTRLIEELASWLREHNRGQTIPGGIAIAREYSRFRSVLPRILGAMQLEERELTFGDYTSIVTHYLIAAEAEDHASSPI